MCAVLKFDRCYNPPSDSNYRTKHGIDFIAKTNTFSVKSTGTNVKVETLSFSNSAETGNTLDITTCIALSLVDMFRVCFFSLST